jgi:hypothetical protein
MILQRGLCICGRHHAVETFLEEMPDSLCEKCCRWGHIEPNCKNELRCLGCGGGLRIAEHDYRTPGCDITGFVCIRHGEKRCPNCKGPHQGNSCDCAVRREALDRVHGWKKDGCPAALQEVLQIVDADTEEPQLGLL